jgi:glyoxylase-like metal-dependent hydrolase (beta-lactamase superfamily II)
MVRWFAFIMTLTSCAGSVPDGGGSGNPDGNVGNDGSVTLPDAPNGSLEGGSLTVSWMHGSANCANNTDPEVQVHTYNPTVRIIRQNKCRTFEAPFIYLIEGNTTALLIDSGATNTTTLRTTVRGVIGTKPLIVAHSHGHGDHRAGDGTFSGQPNTSVVANSVAAVQAQFSIAAWPTGTGTIDLGGRVLDVLGIPGHEATHIAIYDRKTGLLFTGDSLYPGLLFVNDWATYRTSIKRLAQFAASHPIAHVLGAHIEMTSTPKQAYPYMTTYQPNEHGLPLTAAHVAELDSALTQLGGTPPANPVAYNDFVIDPQ